MMIYYRVQRVEGLYMRLLRVIVNRICLVTCGVRDFCMMF